TLFALVLPHPPHSTPFPYTTLFRSRRFTNDLPESLGQMGLIGKTELGRDAGDSHVAFRQQLLRPIDALRHLPLQWCLAGRLLERSEEHTSELQSRENLVCRLLLEKK